MPPARHKRFIRSVQDFSIGRCLDDRSRIRELHYVFDLWAHRWRGHHANGNVMIVRYADDSVLGFESKGASESELDQAGTLWSASPA